VPKSFQEYYQLLSQFDGMTNIDKALSPVAVESESRKPMSTQLTRKGHLEINIWSHEAIGWARKQRTLSWLCLIGMLALLGSPAASDEKSIEEQASEIVGSEERLVKKWVYKPKVAVLFDGSFDKTLLEKVLTLVDSEVTGFPGFGSIAYFDLATLHQNPVGATRIRPLVKAKDGDERFSAQIQFANDSSDIIIEANILVSFADISTNIMFGVLNSNSEKNRSLRDFAEGTTPCFFNTLSKDSKLQIAGVYIRNDLEKSLIEECLYEEFTQALGLLADFPDSVIFSYDDQLSPPPDRKADILLLRALYDESVSPGDSSDKVARIFVDLYE
jgi:Protein of unknown function (DUF2927)